MQIDRDLQGVVGVLGEPLALGLGAAEDLRCLGGELARGQRLAVREQLVQALGEAVARRLGWLLRRGLRGRAREPVPEVEGHLMRIVGLFLGHGARSRTAAQ